MPIFNVVGGGGTSIFLVTESGDVAGLIKADADPSEVLTATGENDIREGKVAITASGKTTGTKKIPGYETSEGQTVIMPGKPFEVYLPDDDAYDYTKLQAIFCLYGTEVSDSVAATMVAIEDSVYNVEETTVQHAVTKDSTEKTIDFGFTNNTENPVVIRYFTYREES